jgi:hypothetical protein
MRRVPPAFPPPPFQDSKAKVELITRLGYSVKIRRAAGRYLCSIEECDRQTAIGALKGARMSSPTY